MAYKIGEVIYTEDGVQGIAEYVCRYISEVAKATAKNSNDVNYLRGVLDLEIALTEEKEED